MNLSSIYKIEKTSLDLIESAGFHDVEALADSEVEALHAALKRANSKRKIASIDPSRADVERWIGMARDLVGIADETTALPVNQKPTPDLASRLSAAPFALPLPAHSLVSRGLSVAAIPQLLNYFPGDLEAEVEARAPRSLQPRVATASEYVRLGEQSNSSQRLEIDTSRIQSTENFGQSKQKAAGGSKSLAVDERVALICGPLEKTNKGSHPESRRYIRGVLHMRPFTVISGAMVTSLVIIALPCSLAAGALLFLSTELPDYFGWVPSWLLVLPIALPLLGICYLIWGVHGSCRVCGQKLFVHRPHIKSPKAHRIPGLGYILPLCIHLLVFWWFRCTHCGTSIRLKE